MITLTLHDTSMKGPICDISAELNINEAPTEAQLWVLANDIISTRMSTDRLVDDPEDNWDEEDVEVLTMRFENTENRYDEHPYNEVLPR